ncbi:hypothetical protein Taro_050875 [Colocasia esculenta]|uniref:Uncharacterized protein n=1 Tax=Colocasia esculenta TaxID=4460 RepID=A0A843XF91_COLES|nr:hypothetical protein [Colocasia esculenta]
MPAGDKQQPLSVKKVALRDLSNETRNIVDMPQGSSPLTKGKGHFSDALKVSGVKRHHPDQPRNSHHQPTRASSTNGHLVYVRRKLEEIRKPNSDVLGTTNLPPSIKVSNNGQKELSCSPDQVQEPKVSCFPALSPISAASLTISSRGPSVPCTVGVSMNSLPMVEPNSLVFSTAMPALANSPSAYNVQWKERFLRLQNFLHKCDQSNQEEYMQMLRSLSAVGRSKHAVELEKRAINLLLEEDGCIDMFGK